jgi:type VI secretion system protein ImpG
MADELLPYYNQELLYLTKLGAEFAERHPAAAGRLRVSGDSVEDPHVSRLMQGVAFLNARIRRKLDDEFPELTDALLGQLYPHYLAPIPSMSIVSFAVQKDLAESRAVRAGCELETEAIGGETCRFRTSQDVQLWPVELESASLTGRPLIGPASPRGCVAVLRLSLRCLAPEMTIDQLAPDSLRFFLRGPSAEAMRLYELIFNDAAVVAVAASGADPQPLLLDARAIRPVGFSAHEGILPYPPRSPLGYRLLTEYFTFPEKFLFFELAGLGARLRQLKSRTFEIYLYLTRSVSELERNISATSFALHCVPVVNLFKHRAEAIPLTHTRVEYPVVPDSRRPAALEVYSIDSVAVSRRSGEIDQYTPFFGRTHAGARSRESRFWHATRRPAADRDNGSEVCLSFVDLQGAPAQADDQVVSVETTCFNRDLPSKLPFGGGRPHLRFVQAVPGISAVLCLTPPTSTIRQPVRKEGAWRLISHLSLNHLSLLNQPDGAEALREILRLYDFRDAPETRAMIESVLKIRATRGTARAPDPAMGALCRGLDIGIEFDEQRASGTGVFLLASVLERFVAHYASINSFTRLTATVEGRAGVLRTWPPRAGDLALL